LALSPIHFFLLVLSTLFITAGGNVINDVFDFNIDLVNKGEKQVLKSSSALNAAKKIYVAIIIIGAIISLYVAYDIENLKLFFIYPAAVLLLFLYSYKLKHVPLIGNMIVSTFIALVIYILVFAERVGVAELANNHENLYLKFFFLIYGFMWFAFLTNMMREIVKDVEDLEGDREHNSKTLPIVIGLKWAKIMALLFNLLLVICLIFLNMKNDPDASFYKSAYEWILLLFAIAFLKLIWQANLKEEFYRISQSLKIYMILGLLYVLFYYNF